MDTHVHSVKSEESPRELVLSFHHAGLEQITGKCLYLLKHLTYPLSNKPFLRNKM